MPKPHYKLALLALLTAPSASPTFAAFGDQLWQWIDGNAVTALAASDGTIIVGSHTASFRKGKATLVDASTGTTLRTLVADDGNDQDFFGWSVDIGPDIAAIGARYDGDSGAYAGSAYLFDIATGEQLRKYDPIDEKYGRSRNELGYSISISGDKVFTGAPFDSNSNGKRTGAAHVFDISNHAIDIVTPPSSLFSSSLNYGLSVAVDDNWALLGNFKDVQVIDTATNTIVGNLSTEESHFADAFGTTVALDGEFALVGAHRDNGNGEYSGTAYVFNVTTGELISELIPEDGTAGAQFGGAVAIEGNLALVGAEYDDEHGSNSGAAYLFDINTGEQLAKLSPHDAGESDRFGSAVALSNGIAYVASPWRTAVPVSGHVYAFDAHVIPESSSLVNISLALIAICLNYRFH